MTKRDARLIAAVFRDAASAGNTLETVHARRPRGEAAVTSRSDAGMRWTQDGGPRDDRGGGNAAVSHSATPPESPHESAPAAGENAAETYYRLKQNEEVSRLPFVFTPKLDRFLAGDHPRVVLSSPMIDRMPRLH